MKNFNKILNTLNNLVNFYDMPIIFSTHPRTRKKIEKSKIKLSSKIKLLNHYASLHIINYKYLLKLFYQIVGQ